MATKQLTKRSHYKIQHKLLPEETVRQTLTIQQTT